MDPFKWKKKKKKLIEIYNYEFQHLNQEYPFSSLTVTKIRPEIINTSEELPSGK